MYKELQNHITYTADKKSPLEENIIRQISKLNRDITDIKQQIFHIGNAFEILANENKKLAHANKKLYEGLKRFIPRTLLPMRVALAEHCNLNCRGCDHFSPIAEPQFADFTSLAMDFARLSALFDGQADEILLMGGEPLLHPEIEKFMVMARQNFRCAKIEVVTNGVLLMKEPESFWETCRDNNIAINVTKYPIPLDFKAMEEKSASYGVNFHYFDGSGGIVKTLFQHKLSEKRLKTLGQAIYFAAERIVVYTFKTGGCTLAP